MREIIKQDLISVFERAIKIIREKHTYLLRELSDHVIHNASIFQDEDSVSIAVLIYALSKIFKNDLKGSQAVLIHLEKAKQNLQKNKFNSYRKRIKAILDSISATSIRKKFYLEEVLERAQIKKASKIYEHGISLAQVADTLGVSRWELMDYIGKTTIADSFESIESIEDKIEFTRSLFAK